MTRWIRALIRTDDAPAEWHALGGDKEFGIADALCGERFPAAVEVAPNDERTTRDGRCAGCETALSAREQRTMDVVHR
jgi:hypothetical protein